MKIKIDFDIIPTSPHNIKIWDSSKWHWSEDKPSWLTIIPPGSTKCITIPFEKGAMNVVTAKDINLGCGHLSDGLYTITVHSNFKGVEKTKFYLKTDTIEYETSKKVIEADKKGVTDPLFQETFFSIKWLIEVAKAYTQCGDEVNAVKYFNIAVDRSKRLIC